MFDNLPEKVKIIEVGTRDGFQMEANPVSTEDKVDIINRLAETNIKNIEVTSFVHPKVIPQLADAEAVMKNIKIHDDITYSALVPNMRGAQRALSCGINEWGLMYSVSESHSKANVNQSPEDMLKEVESIIELAKRNNILINGGLITALGCPFEGKIDIERIYYGVSAYRDLGVKIINVADTAGLADPAHVYYVMKHLVDKYEDIEFVLHLHDTRGMAMANVLAGLQAGVTTFDSAIGGIGGCPFVPGAAGNIATEDLVHMLDLMGIETGVNLDEVINVSKHLEIILGRKLNSKVSKAGKASELKELIQ